jgi:hypothetical protein
MSFEVISFTPTLNASILANNEVFMVDYEVQGVFNKNLPRKLTSIVVLDGDDQNVAFDLVFSDRAITLGTANEVISITDANAANVLGVVKFVVATHAQDFINSIVFVMTNINLIMQPNGSSDSLFVSAIVRSGTPTFTAAGMKIKLGFE